MTRAHMTKTTGKVVIARLEPGEDILHSIEKVAMENKVQSGQLSMIGAVSRIHLGYFDRKENLYKDFKVVEDLEIVSGIGNIAKYDNTLIIHAHLVASDETGKCYGGHLLEGCEISVTAELIIIEVPELKRAVDDLTGLKLLDI
jgi:predicted DNA-binding protein with PD1-like motif